LIPSYTFTHSLSLLRMASKSKLKERRKKVRKNKKFLGLFLSGV
jgi:hypothetical protein